MNATNTKRLGLGVGLAGWLALSIVVLFEHGIGPAVALNAGLGILGGAFTYLLAEATEKRKP